MMSLLSMPELKTFSVHKDQFKRFDAFQQRTDCETRNEALKTLLDAVDMDDGTQPAREVDMDQALHVTADAEDVPDLTAEEKYNLMRLILGRINARAKQALTGLGNDNTSKAAVQCDKITELSAPFAREN